MNKTKIDIEKDLLKSMPQIYKSEHTKKIIEMISKMKKHSELEVSINRLQKITIAQYIDLVKYVVNIAEDNKHFMETTLDITYQYNTNDNDNYSNYRISIDSLERINVLLSNLSIRRNHSIFSILTNNIINQRPEDSKYLYIINKIKKKSSIIDITDFDIRFRSSEELPVPKEKLQELIHLSETERNKISFRYKDRLSYIINANAEFDIRIDLTDIKQNMSINRLSESNSLYELELEIIKKTDKPFTDQMAETAYNKLLLEIYHIHQIIQKSTKIITISQKEQVLNKMKTLLYGTDKNDTKDLPGMQTESLENQHVASELATQYSITDKADGERYFLMIISGRIFLISNNLNIKEIDSSKYPKLSAFDNTILDGEYLYIEEHNKFMFLAFDILVYKNTDVRDESKLENRLAKLNDVLKNGLNVRTTSSKQSSSNKLPDIIKNTKELIHQMFDEMNDKLKKDPHVIMGKLYLIPIGLYKSELFVYSDIIWNLYTKDESIKCPYTLDGLIYTPLNQKYTRSKKDIQYKIYKWKPPSHNSIDFFVKFEKNQDTGSILNVYDNSNGKDIDEKLDKHTLENDTGSLEEMTDYLVNNKVYRIINLCVGSNKTGIEIPVPFNQEQNLHLAYLYITDGEIRDIEGNIIQDNTVVEFSYNNNPLLEHPFRWIPLRTRFDKTESVIKYQRKYGNNEEIANRVWRSIILPFDFFDIKQLSNENTFDSHMEIIKNRVTKELIAAEQRENNYYQVRSNLAKPQRNFHNFIKSNLIYTYCNIKMLNNLKFKKLRVLDIGVGRGGDLQKYYHARVDRLVGFDIDPNGIYSTTDSVTSRYQTMSRKMPNFPPCTFFVASSNAKLNLTNQEKIITNLSEQNKESLRNIFGKTEDDTKFEKFDIFSSQMMIHFIFESDQTLDNFCSNVNKYLNKDGYLIITTTDGRKIHNSFVNNKITTYYTDETGKKKIFFEFKKLYTDDNIKKTGVAIEYFNASFKADDNYNTEYLVDPEFLIDTFESKCGLTLVDTDNFGNLFNNYKYFFENIAPYEAKDETRKYFSDTYAFYDFNNEVNRSSFEHTRMHNYFIFQKN